MKVSLGEINNSLAALRTLASLKFPARVAYRLGRVLKTAESEVADFKRINDETVRRLGAPVKPPPDKDGNLPPEEAWGWQVTPENMAQFVAEITEFLDEQIELWGDPLPLELLGDVQIEPQVLANLDWLIDGGEQADAQGLVNGKATEAEAHPN